VRMEAGDESTLSAFLASLPLFCGVRQDLLARLSLASRRRHAPKGSLIFSQLDQPDAFYIVQSGKVAIVLASAGGRELVINEMRPGDCFGELGLLTGRPRSADAVTRVDSWLVVTPRSAFQTLLDDDPQVMRRLLEITARRLSTSSERESALAFMDAEARLARVLLELDQQETEKGYVTISQEGLAQLAGLTRQTVASIIGRWRRRGWLITGRGRIMVLAHGQLQQLQAETAP
jgi:CRP/FNR family transcriptional regulator, cyclic AMP receptor protein